MNVEGERLAGHAPASNYQHSFNEMSILRNC